MRKFTNFVIMASLVALAACTPLNSNSETSVVAGPCVGTLCLGSEVGDSYAANCSENLSVTNAVEIRLCPVEEPLSVAGARATSGELTVVDGIAGRLRLQFHKSSCSFLRDALFNSLGESSRYRANDDGYRILYSSVGYPNRLGSLFSTEFDRQWKSQNGRFVLRRDDLGSGDACELQVDSGRVADDLEQKIASEAENSIIG